MSDESAGDSSKLPPSTSPTEISGPGAADVTLPDQPDFEVLGQIGRGAYGEVYLTRDKADQYWAVKVVYRVSFEDDRPYEREYKGILKFEPVSRLSASQLQIRHVGRRDEAGYFYYIMEAADDVESGRNIHPDTYVPHTLKSELRRRRRIPAGESCHLARALAVALANLHHHGLVHRDIKPANIIFAHGQPKLADVGLVTHADLTISCAGTEGYIPPEGPGSFRADIYSLGKVLYEIATGCDRLDFPKLPADFAELPEHQTLLELNAIFSKACHANPRKRYPSADRLAADLEWLGRGKSVRRKNRLQKLALVSCGAVGALAVALAATIWLRSSPNRPTSSDPMLSPISLVDVPAPQGRFAVPAEGEIKAARSRLEQTLASRLANATANDKAGLALELFREESSTNPVPLRLAKLQCMADLAADAGDLHVAKLAWDTVEKQFDFAPLKMNRLRTDTLQRMNRATGAPDVHASITRAGLALGFRCLAMDDYSDARRLEDVTMTSARFAQDRDLQRQCTFFGSEVERCRAAFQKINEYVDRLRINREDPQANAECGKFLCFYKNAWQKGGLLLQRGDDKALAALLTKESSRPTSIPDCMQIGDDWWTLAGQAAEPEKTFYLKRAGFWYCRALGRAENAEKESLNKKLKSKLSQIPHDTGRIHIFLNADEGTTITIRPLVLAISTEYPIRNAGFNHVDIGDLRKGGPYPYLNTGETRFLPESVDFSKARLIRSTISDASGKIDAFEVNENHVTIRLSHPPAGSADFDLTVDFND